MPLSGRKRKAGPLAVLRIVHRFAMAHAQPDYATLIRQQGFRVTSQRRLILEALRQCGGHVSPEAVYACVRQKATAVNRATIYRNLDFLCQMRLVVAAQVNGHRLYEIAGAAPHHHLVCRLCGRVIDLPHRQVEAFCATIARQEHFSVELEHLVLPGLCPKCQRAALTKENDKHMIP